MVCHDFRLARHDVDKALLECARNLAVQLLPAALEQTLIGRIPHQRVLEAVNGFRRLATAEHEPGLLELGQPMLQCGLVASPVKEIGQIGAAIGREFSYSLLRAVVARSNEDR